MRKHTEAVDTSEHAERDLNAEERGREEQNKQAFLAKIKTDEHDARIKAAYALIKEHEESSEVMVRLSISVHPAVNRILKEYAASLYTSQSDAIQHAILIASRPPLVTEPQPT